MKLLLPLTPRRWRLPCLLAVTAALLAFVAQSGELGSADTGHRLQTAHSWWTSEPPVFPDEYPEFGVHGRHGKLESWYGMGQSLLLLPADIAGSLLDRFLNRIPAFDDYDGTDPTVRDIVVTYSVNILLSVLTALACFFFLLALGFHSAEAGAGVLAMLLATSHLHYTQNLMENNYIYLLTLAGFWRQLEWARSGDRRALLQGSAAFGLNLLTRLTTGMDLLAGALFIFLLLRRETASGGELRRRLADYCRTALPVYGVFLLIDRLYQFYRFGSFFTTYLGLAAQEAKLRDPSLPASYPFENPFHAGFFGALFQPEKSIFLFDPLLILTLLLAAAGWRRFSPEIKAYLAAAAAMLLAYLVFYAKYTVWSGDFAWGDRYVSTAVELATLPALPLLLRHRKSLGRLVWGAGVAILGASAAIQAASLAFWLPLEIYQMETLGHPTFVIALRMRNIAAFALGRMDAWGLNNHAMTEDPWDYVHITTWNFLPFLLRRVGAAPGWAVDAAFALWIGGLAGLAAALWRTLQELRAAGRSREESNKAPCNRPAG
jgi:hypothetical protein